MPSQVSWFRREGPRLDILTVGRDSFSLDARYSVALERPNNWRLRVRPTMRRDNGSYLCQVSTHPPIILVTHLKIIGKYRVAHLLRERDMLTPNLKLRSAARQARPARPVTEL